MPGYTRHNEIIVLDSKPGTVEAHFYNIAQTGIKRLGKQLRFRIPSLNHLDLILQEDAWIVVDRVLNDMPVAAWTGFQTKTRDNLHEPIACEIRIYHFAARVVLKTALDAMEEILMDSLAKQNTNRSDKVLTLKTNNDNDAL